MSMGKKNGVSGKKIYHTMALVRGNGIQRVRQNGIDNEKQPHYGNETV